MAQQGCRAGAGSCPCPRKLLCVFSNCTMMCRGDCEARGNLCLSLQMPWHFLVPSLTASCSWQPHAPFAAGVTFLLGCSVLGRGLLPHSMMGPFSISGTPCPCFCQLFTQGPWESDLVLGVCFSGSLCGVRPFWKRSPVPIPLPLPL